MTSRPLFISVAESIVILPPMSHVGCSSASSTRDLLELAARAPAKRAAGRGQDEVLDRPGPLAGDQLMQRGVLGVDGQDLRAGRLRERHHELAADDERLLVGEREVDALAERRDRRAEPGGADERVQDEVGAGLEHELDEPLGAGQHLPVGPLLGRARGRVGVGERDPVDAEAAAPGRSVRRDERSALSPTSSRSGSRATISSACVPIEPVEPRMRRRRDTPAFWQAGRIGPPSLQQGEPDVVADDDREHARRRGGPARRRARRTGGPCPSCRRRA